ncbi:hypothetical protein VKT23_004971 [Stygiomarasmius scandens]|uniref:receptor protein-tyrosine kinase n=1 Tax=Marasmiellus scandens TaxID=2682957 RepID=A0ABR1JRW5_9AGAR
MLDDHNLIADGFDADSASSCKAAKNGTSLPYNTGLAIEGLAVLYTAGIQGQSQFNQLLFDLISASTNSTSPWIDKNGIIVSTSPPSAVGHPPKGGDSYLVRGFITAYQLVFDQKLKDYVQQYLAAQYNAVLDLSTTGKDNIYGSSWTGPPFSQFSAENQTLALSMLVNAIALTGGTTPDNTTSSTTSATGSPSGSSNDSHSNNTGPIAGAIIGGLAFIISTALAAFCFWRRHRQKRRRRYTSGLSTGLSDNMLPIFPRDQISEGGTSSRRKGNDQSQSQSQGQTVAPSSMTTSRKIRQSQNIAASSTSAQQSRDLEKNMENIDVQQMHNNAAQEEVPSIPSNTDQISEERNQDRESSLHTEARMRDLSIEELVRMLNQRLQPGPHWEREEMPPQYPSS